MRDKNRRSREGRDGKEEGKGKKIQREERGGE